MYRKKERDEEEVHNERRAEGEHHRKYIRNGTGNMHRNKERNEEAYKERRTEGTTSRNT